MYTIEKFSKKSLWRRRQYHWRIRHFNGKIIARSSESYNNQKDRDTSLDNLLAGIKKSDYTIISIML